MVLAVMGQNQAYERHKQRALDRQREQTKSGQDIGEVVEDTRDEKTWMACRRDFRLFAETYFPATFKLAWSQDHLMVIGVIERVVLDGGQFAIAMPRGSGKTSLSETAALWALLYGHRRFVLLIGATDKLADKMMRTLKSALLNNELLLRDFRCACYPIRRIGGQSSRCRGQMANGKLTDISWGKGELVMPNIPGAPSSESVAAVAGITGMVRGHNRRCTTGETIRPDMAIVDDPQTRESARSQDQCEQRLKIIEGDVSYAAGPTETIAILMPCTVICKNDAADQALDREKNPQWQGVRTKFLTSMPTNMEWWDTEYRKVRAKGLRAGLGMLPATEFYQANRETADAGAVASWPERFEKGEASAIQSGMNMWLKSPDAFAAEYQNEPLDMASEQDAILAVAVLAKRCVPNIEWQVVPAWADILTCTIDVGLYVMHWEMTAWNLERDQSAVIEVQRLALASGDPTGRNRRDHTTLSKEVDPRRRAQLAALAIREGLADILRQTTIPDHYRNPDGSPCTKIPLWGVDVGGNVKFNEGQSTEIPFPFQATVMEFCGSHGARWHPMKGVAPWSENKLVRAGRGHAYYSPDAGMWLTDTDYYKTKLYAAYQRPTLDKDAGLVDGTRVFYSGLAEFDEGRYLKHQEAEEVDERGRWQPKKPKRPNHFWDCAYMSFALSDIYRNFMPVASDAPEPTPRPHAGNGPSLPAWAQRERY
jgi:hypothetical protein